MVRVLYLSSLPPATSILQRQLVFAQCPLQHNPYFHLWGIGCVTICLCISSTHSTSSTPWKICSGGAPGVLVSFARLDTLLLVVCHFLHLNCDCYSACSCLGLMTVMVKYWSFFQTWTKGQSQFWRDIWLALMNYCVTVFWMEALCCTVKESFVLSHALAHC